MTGMASPGSMNAMPTTRVNPALAVRIPEDVQNLARARAAQENIPFGRYITRLIINDGGELTPHFVTITETETEIETETEG